MLNQSDACNKVRTRSEQRATTASASMSRIRNVTKYPSCQNLISRTLPPKIPTTPGIGGNTPCNSTNANNNLNHAMSYTNSNNNNINNAPQIATTTFGFKHPVNLEQGARRKAPTSLTVRNQIPVNNAHRMIRSSEFKDNEIMSCSWKSSEGQSSIPQSPYRRYGHCLTAFVHFVI